MDTGDLATWSQSVLSAASLLLAVYLIGRDRHRDSRADSARVFAWITKPLKVGATEKDPAYLEFQVHALNQSDAIVFQAGAIFVRKGMASRSDPRRLIYQTDPTSFDPNSEGLWLLPKGPPTYDAFRPGETWMVEVWLPESRLEDWDIFLGFACGRSQWELNVLTAELRPLRHGRKRKLPRLSWD